MNKGEAIALLEAEIDRFRDEPYDQLAGRIEEGPIHLELTGTSGTKYHLEVLAVWDNRPDGNIRVIASIDDGGWRAFSPLGRDFIKAPDGSFVGE